MVSFHPEGIFVFIRCWMFLFYHLEGINIFVLYLEIYEFYMALSYPEGILDLYLEISKFWMDLSYPEGILDLYLEISKFCIDF
jgi:hypothetical protein